MSAASRSASVIGVRSSPEEVEDIFVALRRVDHVRRTKSVGTRVQRKSVEKSVVDFIDSRIVVNCVYNSVVILKRLSVVNCCGIRPFES